MKASVLNLIVENFLTQTETCSELGSLTLWTKHLIFHSQVSSNPHKYWFVTNLFPLLNNNIIEISF
jgi:hypothetical protein